MGEYADISQLYDPDWDQDYDEDGNEAPTGPGACPVCDAITVLRIGKYGRFYGCTNYPKCRGSRYYSGPDLIRL